MYSQSSRCTTHVYHRWVNACLISRACPALLACGQREERRRKDKSDWPKGTAIPSRLNAPIQILKQDSHAYTLTLSLSGPRGTSKVELRLHLIYSCSRGRHASRVQIRRIHSDFCRDPSLFRPDVFLLFFVGWPSEAASFRKSCVLSAAEWASSWDDRPSSVGASASSIRSVVS